MLKIVDARIVLTEMKQKYHLEEIQPATHGKF